MVSAWLKIFLEIAQDLCKNFTILFPNYMFPKLTQNVYEVSKKIPHNFLKQSPQFMQKFTKNYQ